MGRNLIAFATALVIILALASPAIAAEGARGTLLINQVNTEYPEASDIRGQQVLMLLRHFDPSAEIIRDTEYETGGANRFDRVVVLGNDAVTPISEPVRVDLGVRKAPMMWVGYGLGHLSPDPDRQFGFAPEFVDSDLVDVEIEYRGHQYPTVLEERHRVRIASPDAAVYASIVGEGDPIPLAIRHADMWFFGGLPALDSDYPDASTDTLTLVFADLLSDFYSVRDHPPAQALIRLEDVSVHIQPERIIEAVDALAQRGVPFVIGVIPAQQLDDGSVASLADHPQFVQALRYAQDRGGTVALHGYHHTFGQGEDYEFWDPERDAPPIGETWAGYALKVEDGIRELRKQGLEPRLWETPHYAASPLGYRVFGSYFSHAIENRDPATWLPYIAGPDTSGQILVPENLGYINEDEGLLVEDQLARAELLQIVRDAYAVGFYHPASIPVADLERLVDGLSALGYRFSDVRTLPLTVTSDARPPLVDQAVAAVGIEPGLTLLGMRQRFGSLAPATAMVGAAASWVLPIGIVVIFLWRLREQWHPTETGHTSRVESRRSRAWPTMLRGVALTAVVLVVVTVTRVTVLSPIAPRDWPRERSQPIEQPDPETIPIEGWELSTYYTAAEKFYAGPRVELRGCLTIDCANGSDVLGNFPADFLAAVKAEGSGRLSAPAMGKTHLNWSIDIGYWLDSAPRDAQGSILQPFVSAAADPDISYVSTFEIDDCGADVLTGRALPAAACDAFTASRWIVRDRFTVGEVGKQLDLYVGDQDRSDFVEDSPTAIHTVGGAIRLARYSPGRWAS